MRAFHASHRLGVVHRANHYAILGVPTSATQSEIKSAFYKSSMQWHPDKNQGSDEAHQKFLKLNEAYSVLGSEQSRRAYDRTLQIRSGGYSGRSSAPHRYHNSAFTSSGEYSSAKRSSPQAGSSYTRPSGTYTQHTRNGQRVKSNFEEWERKHYQDIKKKAEDIGQYAREAAGKSSFTPTQVTFYQFYELCIVFAAVFGIAWAGSHVIRVADDSNAETQGHTRP
ncbi:DnaJ-domain-containing protein [Martensiomyces pterosporus]|nr:DnaJ-domain-containing protein [Martensiomyces pterosporus]